MILRRNQVNVLMADSSIVTPEVVDALSNVQNYFYQTPNSKILIFPFKMRLYCATNPNDSSRWSNFWRTQGEPPVIYDPGAAQRTANQIVTLLKTRGCFNSTVSVDTTQHKGSFVTVNYNILATQRRQIDELSFGSPQPDIQALLDQWKAESLLKKGDFYDQQVMSAEQARIVSNLKNEGYYYATNDVVHFYVDTNYSNQVFSIYVSVRMRDNSNGTSSGTLQKYHIDNIYIYPNVSTTIDVPNRHFDTLIFPYHTRRGSTNYNFIYDSEISPSPQVISRSMFIFNGQTYRPRIVSNTSNSLFGLHNFKYVDINFEESPNSCDTNRLLDARIRLLNSTRHRLSLSLELTNASSYASNSGNNFLTSGNLGLGSTLGYQNNNLFGGAELLKVEGSLLFDLPKNVFVSHGKGFHNTFSSFESGLNLSLDLPIFLLPFANNIQWQSNKPHTLVELYTNYLYRELSIPDFSSDTNNDLTLEQIRFGSSLGYTWSHNRNVQHKLLPFNLSFAHIISGRYFYHYISQITSNPQLVYQANDYILLNTHYEYTFSNQRIGTRTNFHYSHFSIETAGNLLNSLNSLFGNERPNNGIGSENEVVYYQYFRFEGEFKQYLYLGAKRVLVLRSLLGFGIPYGRRPVLPYEKMFVGGGPTTMRGWLLRHLGPGQSFSSESDFALGTGEIQFVINVEHRFPIISIFEGAFFADVGNVWDCNDWGIGRSSNFDPDDILQGIAFDAGVGLRANISIITLRLDLALPLYDPGYQAGQRWFTDHPSWNKIAINFGINYPF